MSIEQNPSLKTISLRILHLLVDSTYVGIYHLISQLIFLDDPKVFVLGFYQITLYLPNPILNQDLVISLQSRSNDDPIIVEWDVAQTPVRDIIP